MRRFIEQQTGEGRPYQSVDDYFAALISYDMVRRHRERVNELLLESLNDDVVYEVGPDWREQIMRLADQHERHLKQMSANE